MKQSIISLLFLLLLQTLITFTTSDPDIVQNTCKRCADPDISYTQCMDFFNSNSKSHQANLPGLGVIATNIAKGSATNVKSIIKKILNGKAQISPSMKQCLDICLENYDEAIVYLSDSVKAIEIGHYKDANMWIGSAMDVAVLCEDEFKEGKIESPFAKENHDFFGQTIIPLCIAAQLGGLGG